MSAFPFTSVWRLDPAQYVFVCLCVVWCAASPSAARAQESAALNGNEKRAAAIDPTMTYSCVDPTDPTARRRFQKEPCKLPMYQAITPDPTASPSRRWPSYPPRSLEAHGAHPMFWRFPVQPGGPHEVPRHSWR
jgi:hypothetical protein